MWATNVICGYIDPNTSQHIFSLAGPILAFLGATGGLALTGLVLVRRRIASYFRQASWAKRIATVSAVMGALALVSVVVWGLLG